ncbi:MAG: hypothetical protein KDD37_02470 [Bdellovibrionales bacterium]|nr:hypothetical protein [Bdellovibrionales bacterium]
MTKFLLFISIGVIVYLLLQPSQNVPLDSAETAKAIKGPIVSDPPKIVENIEEAAEPTIAEEIKNLPVEEPEQLEPMPKAKSGLSSLKLIGTIYGTDNPSAMLADGNNKTFIVRLRQKVLKSDYVVTKIDKDRIHLFKGGKTYVLVMNKAR